MKRLLYLGLILVGILSLTAFLISLYRSLRLYILAPQPGSTLIYHFSLYIPDNRNSFFLGIIRGAEQAAAELESAISVHSIDPAKNELEIAAFTGVDGVIVCPYLDDALARRQLEKLREYQIPAALINHNLPSEQPWPFIGINTFDMGRRIGLILEEDSQTSFAAQAALVPSEKITLAVVYSDKAPGIYAERELVEMGISATLGDRLSGPIMSYRTNLNPLDAEALLVNIFRRIEDTRPGANSGGAGFTNGQTINTIVFTDPEDTIAASQTLVDLNLVGQIQIIGFGSELGVTENLRKGIISASVVINSERIGYEAVYSLAALRTTGYTSASIDIGIEIITGNK
ncbi:MAG: substrate-binding domain-containing protein [Treponema sp.]|nr:substrate-binding domain-containing protein [Treponema sp.]